MVDNPGLLVALLGILVVMGYYGYRYYRWTSAAQSDYEADCKLYDEIDLG